MSGQIVVGINETPESRLALHRAVEAAASRGAKVRVIRAYLKQPGPDPIDEYQAELDAAVAYANDRLGAGRASGRLVNGTAARAILDESIDAELIVLGSETRQGSVATAVTQRATCPVIVVRGGNWRTGPIVVGTDGSAHCEAPVDFAFEEAERAHVPLTVAYGWQPLHHHDDQSVVTTTRGLLENWLAGSVELYADKYPDVKVRTTVLLDRPATALTNLTPDASMVVVGSVSQSLLHRAACSIAVVPSSGRH